MSKVADRVSSCKQIKKVVVFTADKLQFLLSYMQVQCVCRYVHTYVYSPHKINTSCQIPIKKKSNSKFVSVSA